MPFMIMNGSATAVGVGSRGRSDRSSIRGCKALPPAPAQALQALQVPPAKLARGEEEAGDQAANPAQSGDEAGCGIDRADHA